MNPAYIIMYYLVILSTIPFPNSLCVFRLMYVTVTTCIDACIQGLKTRGICNTCYNNVTYCHRYQWQY